MGDGADGCAHDAKPKTAENAYNLGIILISQWREDIIRYPAKTAGER
jgi:hypothetical protein